MIPSVHTRHVCCVYGYNMHVLSMGFRDLSCDLAGGLLYTKWPLDVRRLWHRDAIARDSVTCTLCCMIEPALDPDRAGVSLCKCYEIVDSMVEATCL